MSVYFGTFNEISGISAVRFSFQCIMDICHAIGNMAKGQPYLNLREILCENLEVDLDLVESFWSAIFWLTTRLSHSIKVKKRSCWPLYWIEDASLFESCVSIFILQKVLSFLMKYFILKPFGKKRDKVTNKWVFTYVWY